MKKKTLTTIILIVALAMVAAVTVYAVANYGTKEDPLVTSSYLQDVVQPRMEDAYRSTLDGEVREMEDQFARPGRRCGRVVCARDARKRPDAHRPRRHGAPHAHGHCRRDAERRH